MHELDATELPLYETVDKLYPTLSDLATKDSEISMAFSRTRKRDGEQGKCFGEMCSEPSSGLGSIVELGLSDQSQNQIIEASHDVAGVANGHASRILLHRHIASVVQTGLDAPVSSSDLEQARGRGFCAREAGNAKFHFARGAVTMSIASPLKLAFQSIDLCQTRPGRIGIEHLASGNGSDFNAAVPLVHLLSREKIGLDLPKAGLRIFGGKQGLDVLIQLWLVLFHWEDVIALCTHNLAGQASLGVHGITGDHFL